MGKPKEEAFKIILRFVERNEPRILDLVKEKTKLYDLLTSEASIDNTILSCFMN